MLLSALLALLVRDVTEHRWLGEGLLGALGQGDFLQTVLNPMADESLQYGKTMKYGTEYAKVDFSYGKVYEGFQYIPISDVLSTIS